MPNDRASSREAFLRNSFLHGTEQNRNNILPVSQRIVIPVANSTAPIHISGTVQMGSTAGDVQLKWAQATAVSGGTAVQAGSYLRADQI